ncbi:hypothetical protein QYZ87_10870 [Porphyromonadaceae bacterium W3.11]|nr:hypothetical protein [Porphyromonadaceae bacterium W3.11]MDN4753413.1 hypothetical protein [Porphyromonadaceae bacterium W3.11]MDN4753648.1 hypothetical protein [Porphyromonadaceae bacterium W3.11]MDN4753900.1 hypothetical protein [Porphyromonadaceae bacterium W3.11]MDN4755008.1 hypothetical protein [Porphyromonadaceae bacterium W3.11]
MSKQALSVSQVLNQKLETFELSEEWQAFFGKPEQCGTWIIWGKSGNGITNESTINNVIRDAEQFDFDLRRVKKCVLKLRA